jgi:hypothetical protein
MGGKKLYFILQPDGVSKRQLTCIDRQTNPEIEGKVMESAATVWVLCAAAEVSLCRVLLRCRACVEKVGRRTVIFGAQPRLGSGIAPILRASSSQILRTLERIDGVGRPIGRYRFSWMGHDGSLRKRSNGVCFSPFPKSDGIGFAAIALKREASFHRRYISNHSVLSNGAKFRQWPQESRRPHSRI